MRAKHTLLACLPAAFALLLPATPAAPAPAPAKVQKVQAAAPIAAPQKVTTVEGITEYRLANGLRVLMFPDQSKATITVNITYLVGSRHESYGETGMAHLLEHLMFKGSKGHTNIPQELTSHGARPNGSTWFDRTNYFETFQATDENLNWALSLEADRMVNSFIAKKDLDSEMTVVRNEFEMGENNPQSILEERTLSTAYLWHNYGHSTIGARSDIENVPIEHLQAFWRKYYQPDNAVLLVAGKFDEAKTLGLVQKYFGVIPKPTRELQRTWTLEPTQDGERSVTLRRVGDVQAISVIHHVPAVAHADSAAVDALVEVLTAHPSGRLYKALVETKKAASVGGYMQPLNEPGFISISAEVRLDASLDDARTTLLGVLDGFAKNPVTDEEVERAKSSLLKQVDLVMNQSDRLGLFMSEFIASGDWRLFFISRDRIRGLKTADVQRVALTYLQPSNRTVGVFIPTQKPERAEIPATPDIQKLVQDYKGEKAVASGEAFDPSPANIEARVQRTTLASGLKVALLPKKTRGNSVTVSLSLHAGDEKSLMNRATAADLAIDMLMRGTAKHTRQQIKDEFDRLKAQVRIMGSAPQQMVSVETKREFLPEVLTLLAEVLRQPTFPAAELEQLKQENLAQIESQRSEPTAIAANAFQRHVSQYPKGDVRYVPTFDEQIADIKAATIDDVRKYYAEFIGGSFGELAVVGDMDAAEVGKQLNDLFGDWKSPHAFTRVPMPYHKLEALNKTFETPDKSNAFFIAGQLLELRDDDPDYPALVLGDYMLGGGFLNSRLATRIRQKEGLSYGVGSQFSASALDKFGTFVAYAIYAPQNVTKLETAFKEEIAKALEGGFTDKEVADAKSGLLQNRQINRSQDGSLARTLSSYLFIDRKFAWDAELEKKIAALTPAEVQAALKRHLDVNAITIMKAGDFAKANKPAEPAAQPVK